MEDPFADVPPGLLAHGPRVGLRRPRPTDRGAHARLLAASRPFLARFAPAPADDEACDLHFEGLLASARDARQEKFFVVRLADDVLLGALNFNEIVRGAFHSAYLGYWIGAEHAGQGLMAEALEAGLGYAFGPLGLHRVEANIQPGNAASLALVRRAGFVREGFSERYLHIAGAWRDHERWALTIERWAADRGRAGAARPAKNDAGGPEGPPA